MEGIETEPDNSLEERIETGIKFAVQKSST